MHMPARRKSAANRRTERAPTREQSASPDAQEDARRHRCDNPQTVAGLSSRRRDLHHGRDGNVEYVNPAFEDHGMLAARRGRQAAACSESGAHPLSYRRLWGALLSGRPSAASSSIQPDGVRPSRRDDHANATPTADLTSWRPVRDVTDIRRGNSRHLRDSLSSSRGG
jgi:hypothetical protein